MANELLNYFVQQTNSGTFSGLRVALSVAGTVYAGELISIRRYWEEMTERTKVTVFNIGKDATSSTTSWSESGPLLDYLPEDAPPILACLFDPWLLNTGQAVKLGITMVLVSRIDAWSLGIPEGLG